MTVPLGFYAAFVASKVGKTGLADVTFTIQRIVRSTGVEDNVVTDGAATEGVYGVYWYRLADSDLQTYDYYGVARTADATVDAQNVHALWTRWEEASKVEIARMDAAITSRAPTGEAAAALTAYDPPTHAEMTSELATADDAVLAAIAALNNLSSAGAQAAAAAALTAYGVALQTSVDDLEGRLTAARAGYLDNLSAGAVALESTLTAIKGTGWTTQTLVALYSLLSTAAATIATVVTGSTITIHRGDTTTIAITGLGSLAGRSKLWFTVKTSSRDTDAESIIQVRETTGLIYLNGAAAATPTDASLVVDSEALGNITITLKPALTAALTDVTGISYDVQMLTAAGVVTTETTGLVNVTADITRAVS